MRKNENSSIPTCMHKRTNTKLPLRYEKRLRRLTKEISSLILRYRSERLGVGDTDNNSSNPGVDLHRWSNSKQWVGYVSGRIPKDKKEKGNNLKSKGNKSTTRKDIQK